MTNATANLASVQARVIAAARGAKRDPGCVHLVAVTKTFGPDHIVPVLQAGHRLYGENRVRRPRASGRPCASVTPESSCT
jgi:uncharacterized pyridoxal phosphate-containing UPF0001 family protein